MPTITGNIMQKINDSTDEDEIKMLLSLFENIDPSEIPAEALVDFVLTQTDDGHLWLATSDYSDTFEAIFALLSEVEMIRLPIALIYNALEHAVDWADDETDEDDGLNLSIRWATSLALLVQDEIYPIDDDILTRMKDHTQWQCRASAIDILAEMDRIAEIVPFLTDKDEDVATAAIFALPSSQETFDILNHILITKNVSDRVAEAALLKAHAFII